jgi:hypothetical protein
MDWIPKAPKLCTKSQKPYSSLTTRITIELRKTSALESTQRLNGVPRMKMMIARNGTLISATTTKIATFVLLHQHPYPLAQPEAPV